MAKLPTRRANVECVGENRVRFTCLDCGHVWIKPLVFQTGEPFSHGTTLHIVKHWNNSGGAIVKCFTCMIKKGK